MFGACARAVIVVVCRARRMCSGRRRSGRSTCISHRCWGLSTLTFPAYIHLGPVVLDPHVIFETLAYSSGFYLYRRQRRSGDVVDARARSWILGAAFLGGF